MPFSIRPFPRFTVQSLVTIDNILDLFNMNHNYGGSHDNKYPRGSRRIEMGPHY